MNENEKAPAEAQRVEFVPLVDALRLGNLNLKGEAMASKVEAMAEQVRALSMQFRAEFVALCNRHGLPPEKTAIDFETGAVTVRE
jgi:hypothetical protein